MPCAIWPGRTEALAAYEQALSLNPTNPNSWNGKGNALSDLAQPSEALTAYEQALSLNPTNPCIPNGKGNALRNLGRPD